jgi:hypothetical protein
MRTIHELDDDLAAVIYSCALGLALSLTVLSMLPTDAMLAVMHPGGHGWILTEEIR